VDFDFKKLALGYPFLSTYPVSYLTRAFEFTRQFQYQWTVNWRFLSQATFLSRPFSLALLTLHITLLATFLLVQWMQPSNSNSNRSGIRSKAISPSTIIKYLLHPPPKAVQAAIARQVTPDFVLTSISSAVIIGCLCARSLHYQFYVYIVWATPFLLWRAGVPMGGVLAVFAAQEWAWNVFPSTRVSSAVVVGCLAVTAGCSLVGVRFPVVGPAPPPPPPPPSSSETRGRDGKGGRKTR
jgi:alpha-1,3-mannosyltransferase